MFDCWLLSVGRAEIYYTSDANVPNHGTVSFLEVQMIKDIIYANTGAEPFRILFRPIHSAGFPSDRVTVSLTREHRAE